MNKRINFTPHLKSGIFFIFLIFTLGLSAQVSETSVWPKDIQSGEYTIPLYFSLFGFNSLTYMFQFQQSVPFEINY